MFSRRLCEFFKNTFFTERARATALNDLRYIVLPPKQKIIARRFCNNTTLFQCWYDIVRHRIDVETTSRIYGE